MIPSSSVALYRYVQPLGGRGRIASSGLLFPLVGRHDPAYSAPERRTQIEISGTVGCGTF